MKNILFALALFGLATPLLATNSGPGYQDPQQVVTANLGAANAVAKIGLSSGNSICSVAVSGTFSATLTFQVSADGQNWQTAYLTPQSGGATVSTASAAGAWSGNTNGFPYFQVNATSYTSGNAYTSVYCVPVTSGYPGPLAISSAPAPFATAGTPAPAGLAAQGFNGAGPSSPIICTKQATVIIGATTQATETVIVPSASGKTTYVCAVTMYSGTSATTPVGFGLAISATNTCGSLTAIDQAAASVATAPNNVVQGNGASVVTQTTAGTALCFFNALTTPAGTASATIMYEQF